MGFPPTCLVVWDYIRYAPSKASRCGPRALLGWRSLVAYAASEGSRRWDPVGEHGLLFERFLNPEAPV